MLQIRSSWHLNSNSIRRGNREKKKQTNKQKRFSLFKLKKAQNKRIIQPFANVLLNLCIYFIIYILTVTAVVLVVVNSVITVL